MKILLIDDEAMILYLMKTALTLFDHDVVTATNGQEGLDKYNETPGCFDVIVSDINMPILSGIGFAEKLLLTGFITPIILMTGHDGLAEKLNISTLGVLYKPFDIDKLLALLDKVEAMPNSQ